MTIATRRLARRCRERASRRAMEMGQFTTDPTTLLEPAEPVEDEPPPVIESDRGTAGES
jgi:hypothetical protein